MYFGDHRLTSVLGEVFDNKFIPFGLQGLELRPTLQVCFYSYQNYCLYWIVSFAKQVPLHACRKRQHDPKNKYVIIPLLIIGSLVSKPCITHDLLLSASCFKFAKCIKSLFLYSLPSNMTPLSYLGPSSY